MTHISLSGVSYNTPNFIKIFDNITLALPPAKIAIIGDNGVGKTTLLRLINGDILPSDGKIKIDGTINFCPQFPQSHDAKSGGQIQIARLRNAFANSGDFLLLDEPSNNLDSDAITWLSREITAFIGGIIFISHDERILNHADMIVEITRLGIQVFIGNYHEFKSLKQRQIAKAAQDLRTAQNNEKRIKSENQKRLEKQQKRDAAGNKKRAKNDAPKILLDAKQDRAEQTAGRNLGLNSKLLSQAEMAKLAAAEQVEIITPLHFDLPEISVPQGKILLDIKSLSFGYDALILNDFSMQINGASRILLRGKNGTGKTTLLRLIMGELVPQSGQIKLNVPYAYIDQNLWLVRNELSIFDNVRHYHPELNDNQIYAKLARFKFRNKDALKIAGTLSGGEKLRAAFAIAFSGLAPQILLLDEPTNNLDLNSREILIHALRGFGGAILVISHDEGFVRALEISEEIKITPSSTSQASR
jgi:ATPase subunit of ABC transporter with duplicated ATPase domains